MNCHQISVTRVNFSLVIYNYFILMFCKNVPAKCFIIEQIHEKEPDKCPNIQVSDTFKIITLNWGKISEILMENWWIHKTDSKKSRWTWINYRRPNELMKMIITFTISFKTLLFVKFSFPDLKDSVFSSLLSYITLVKGIFATKV